MFLRRARTNPAPAILLAAILSGIGLSNSIPAAAASPPFAATLQSVSAGEFLEAMAQAGPQQTVSFSNTVVTGRVHAGSVGLDTVRAAIRLRGVTFEEQVSFDRVVFGGPVRVSKTTFVQGASLLDARFEQNVSFTKSSFGGHTTFKRARFSQSARFVDIIGNGMMSFSSSLFNGEITDFTRAQFLRPAYFDEATFANTTSFVDAYFKLESSFKEAHWRSEVDFSGARFDQEALFRQARFGGETTFDRSRFRRQVLFDKARFERPASFRDITFVRTASFSRATFIESVDFSHCRFKTEADFSDADFRAPVHLNAYFGRDLILRHATGPLVDLRFVPTDATAENVDSTFSDTSRIHLHNSDFGRMLFDWAQFSGRLAATDTTGAGALGATYGAVRRHLEAMGLAADSRAAFREWMERHRQALPPWGIERLGLEVFGATTRFGTDPIRLLWWALGVILLFAVLIRRLSPKQDDPNGLLHFIYLSLCIFVHLDFHPWHPVGRTRLLVAIEAVTGWLFLAGFVALFVRLLST